jgi:hypothetical protein
VGFAHVWRLVVVLLVGVTVGLHPVVVEQLVVAVVEVIVVIVVLDVSVTDPFSVTSVMHTLTAVFSHSVGSSCRKVGVDPGPIVMRGRRWIGKSIPFGGRTIHFGGLGAMIMPGFISGI